MSFCISVCCSPEAWVHRHDPCHLEYNDSNWTLKELLVPTLSEAGIVTEEEFDDVVETCRSIFQQKDGLEDEGFEGHLHELRPIEGLRLSTSQMMVRGGGKKRMPGGDLLRMANTIIKLRELQSYLSENDESPITVVTVSMDDFIADPEKVTADYLNFLLGEKNGADRDEEVARIASDFARNYHKLGEKGSAHVTTGTHSNKKKLERALRKDPLFGPILDRIEGLVNEALRS